MTEAKAFHRFVAWRVLMNIVLLDTVSRLVVSFCRLFTLNNMDNTQCFGENYQIVSIFGCFYNWVPKELDSFNSRHMGKNICNSTHFGYFVVFHLEASQNFKVPKSCIIEVIPYILETLLLLQ